MLWLLFVKIKTLFLLKLYACQYCAGLVVLRLICLLIYLISEIFSEIIVHKSINLSKILILYVM